MRADADMSARVSSLVLHRGSNLRLLVNLRVLPGGFKAAEIEQRGGALQTHQQ